MKNVALVLVMIVLGGVAYGQNRSELKGPDAKNLKAAQIESDSYMVSDVIPSEMRSLEIKNTQPWEATNNVHYKEVATSERWQLMGPRAKNYKPWKQDESTPMVPVLELADSEAPKAD